MQINLTTVTLNQRLTDPIDLRIRGLLIGEVILF
jgi:hypothetical protein